MRRARKVCGGLLAIVFIFILSYAGYVHVRNLKEAEADILVSSVVKEPFPTCQSEPERYSPPTAEKDTDSLLLDVPYISQKELLPTGCEIISALMLLQYYGYDITADQFIDMYLDTGAFWRENGKLRGRDPAAVFMGDPKTVNGYGCFAPVIVNSLNRILQDGMVAQETGQTSLETLTNEYLKRGVPVLVWASIEMREVLPGTAWTIWPSGEEFIWPRNEHCLVLAGYDEESFYFNDPYEGKGVAAYPKALAERRFLELGRQSVAILDPKLQKN